LQLNGFEQRNDNDGIRTRVLSIESRIKLTETKSVPTSGQTGFSSWTNHGSSNSEWSCLSSVLYPRSMETREGMRIALCHITLNTWILAYLGFTSLVSHRLNHRETNRFLKCHGTVLPVAIAHTGRPVESQYSKTRVIPTTQRVVTVALGRPYSTSWPASWWGVHVCIPPYDGQWYRHQMC